MANNFDSNFTQKLLEGVLESFESKRVVSRTVNTQKLDGAFGADTGTEVNFKRPTDYISQRTSDGDISGTTAASIITGKAKGEVQDYITVEVDFQEADQALKMGNEERFFDDMAQRVVTDLEIDFSAFALKNTALKSGTPGTAVTTWKEVADAGALMTATGVPSGEWTYVGNPFMQTALADVQKSIGAVDSIVSPAFRDATLSMNFGGMKVLTSSALATVSASGADRAGTLTGAPTATYAAAKDTMTQTLAVTGFQANSTIYAGEIVQVTGRNRLNLSTRNTVIDGSGSEIVWSATVTADVTLGASGEGNLVVTGPGIYEATGAYNTVDSALTTSDVITALYPSGAVTQANLFYHRDAFSIGSVPMDKLYSTDTIATTKDGLQLRCSKGASIRENKQIVRIDLRPAYAALNPFFAGQGFGTP